MFLKSFFGQLRNFSAVFRRVLGGLSAIKHTANCASEGATRGISNGDLLMLVSLGLLVAFA